jgi:DNA-binding CsgD family transcriptional regulator
LRSGTRAARAAAERERALRRLVRRMRGCLGILSRGERRVLLLRAAGRSPARVARMTHVSVRRVERLERAGVKRLRAAARGGGCAGGATDASATSASASPATSATGDHATTAVAATTPKTGDDAGTRGEAAVRIRRAHRAADEAASGERNRSPSLLGAPASDAAAGIGLATALLTLALLASLTGFGREVRLTRRGRERPAPRR